VPVHVCRVSAVPLNQVWPGYQRPLDQTELAGFACWDMPGPVQIEVHVQRAPQSVVVRPTSLAIQPRIEGLVMRDPDVWCCSLFGCRDVTISHVKLIGLWRYNADGIDVLLPR
jgi:hypothetical protein